MATFVHVVLIDLLWFGIAFGISLYFLTFSLFSDQELKSKFNKYIFSSTFGLCTLMLVMFLQEVLQSHDKQTSLYLWKIAFLLMDFLLVCLIPLALLKDMWVQPKSKKIKHKGLILVSCCICSLVFVIAYVLFYQYVDAPESPESYYSRIKDILFSTNAQLEFLTIVGIIMNAFMQGFVCTNSIYVYLMENIQDNLKGQYGSQVDTHSDINSLYELHASRIHNTLDQIAFYKRKKLKLQFEITKMNQQKVPQEQKQAQGFFSSWFGGSKQNYGNEQSKVSKMNSKQMESEINDYDKEIKMLNILQKQYAYDLVDFDKWRKIVDYRRTFLGKIEYIFGKLLAVIWIFKFTSVIKNLVYPSYQQEQLNKNIRMILTWLNLYSEEDELYWRIIIQYATMLTIGLLISLNVQSFMRNLLVSLKNILKDYSIKTSYNTTILIFAFIMGAYYLSTLLQLSMNLPKENREAFQNMLDKFNHEFVLYAQDCFFVISCVLCSLMIYFNWVVNKSSQ